jgi:hypothetical protein
MNTIKATIAKLKTRYEANGLVEEIRPIYRIGIGRLIEVQAKNLAPNHAQRILQDSKPFAVYFRSGR